MAKTTVCPICGKEFKITLFGIGGTNGVLTMKNDFSSTKKYAIDVCEDCADYYQPILNLYGDRFVTKLNNMRKATHRKYSQAQIADMMVKYLKEADAHPIYDGEDMIPGFPACFDFSGNFCGTEYDRTSINSSAKHNIKNIDKSITMDPRYVFTADDISRIEFRKAECVNFTASSVLYRYEIRVNDEKEMTFKPCILACYVPVNFFLFSGMRSKKKIRGMLERFCEQIHCNHKIVAVSKFQ